ncbi:uncharacterized protein GGS22DRAFT_174404 [Annulohypoxylon maeteangense]|uniref:uncharacterized protein n=1 Tax=Annulohypoxylon maeteangense TaxID=1927788 RepID=UPI002007B18C|nr:uncharacterized protein GGS22DRAFT_174404 [Annulohypoxylon maeteangense]KAI0880636.1 hypothetical protein GGS22DRAFT_174404 [Annulohypoxylon maeteangense]
MVETPRFANAGGFFPDGFTSLPSPAPSTASSRAAARLPHPRSKPLARGSKKEDYARNYVSDRLMHISRRYVKKHGIPDPADEVTGYDSMDEVCKDLEDVVDVLWFSGTPSLQIPYLLNVALAFNTYLPSFPPSSRPTFALLKKLDHCFASLIIGRDLKSGDPLPGFQGHGRGFTRTDMVRCKSLTDETRMLVSMIMSNEPDVKNFVGDDDDDDNDKIAPSPIRRNISVSLSTGFIQTPIRDRDSIDGDDRIKSEDVINFDDESDIGDEEPDHAAAKRKFKDISLNEETPDDHKRIRVKDEEGLDVQLDDAAPGNRSPIPEVGGLSLRRPGEKFHFILDDDDDDDSGDEKFQNTNSILPDAAATSAAAASVPSTAQIDPNTEGVGEWDGMIDEEGEDEELHLNVGKVYEKTLVQLGKSLGESITDG